MRKITAKERENGMRYCTFCKPAKVGAVFRNQTGGTKPIQLACEAHRHDLVDVILDKREELNDSGRMTEAD